MSQLTHFDESGASRMVDVGAKPETNRTARASGNTRRGGCGCNYSSRITRLNDGCEAGAARRVRPVAAYGFRASLSGLSPPFPHSYVVAQ